MDVEHGWHGRFAFQQRFTAFRDKAASLHVVPFVPNSLEATIEVVAPGNTPRIDDPHFWWLMAAIEATIVQVAFIALIGGAVGVGC